MSHTQTQPRLDPHPRPQGPLGARDEMVGIVSPATGNFYAMSRQDRKFLDAHVKRIVADYNPQSAREKWLANSIAEDMWRLDKARAIENNIYAVALDLPLGAATLTDRGPAHTAIVTARCWMEDPRAFEALARVEQRLRAGIEKNEKELRRLQAERKAAFDKAVEEATLLAWLAVEEGRVWEAAEDYQIVTESVPGEPTTTDAGAQPNPAHETKIRRILVKGFGFSADDLIRTVNRELRLQKARRLQLPQNKPKTMAAGAAPRAA